MIKHMYNYEYLRNIKTQFSRKYLGSKEFPCMVSVGLSTDYQGCLKVGLKKCKSIYAPLTFKGVFIHYKTIEGAYLI